MIDFYELLGINENATTQEIKEAYRKMAKKYHPDINKSKEASTIIVNLNEAKETLLDVDKRKKYDQLLQEMKYSKQFSKNQQETYQAKAQEYKEEYSDVYLTKWQYFFYYLKNGIDHFLVKLVKSFLFLLISFFFFIIKGISIGIIFLLYLSEGLVDLIVGLLFFVAILSLFVLSGKASPDFIPFIPANIENFCFFSILATLLELAKEWILNKSVNLCVILQNIEDKILIKILTK